jgi:hypothetical protein
MEVKERVERRRVEGRSEKNYIDNDGKELKLFTQMVIQYSHSQSMRGPSQN